MNTRVESVDLPWVECAGVRFSKVGRRHRALAFCALVYCCTCIL